MVNNIEQRNRREWSEADKDDAEKNTHQPPIDLQP